MTSAQSKRDLLHAEYRRVRAENDRVLGRWNRQYLGAHADVALARLRDAYAADLIGIETLERVTDDIVNGRPTRMPFLPPRNPTKRGFA